VEIATSRTTSASSTLLHQRLPCDPESGTHVHPQPKTGCGGNVTTSALQPLLSSNQLHHTSLASSALPCISRARQVPDEDYDCCLFRNIRKITDEACSIYTAAPLPGTTECQSTFSSKQGAGDVTANGAVQEAYMVSQAHMVLPL